MTRFKYWILTLLLCFVGLTAFAENANKVLIISSYGSDYQWSNSIVDALNIRLKKIYPGIELNIEYLSSELFVKTDNWTSKMEVILENYQETLPLAIVFVSDEAWLAYNSTNTERFKEVPLLLCAVKPHTIDVEKYTQKKNSLKLSDFQPTTEVMKHYNATGVLREMNISGYIDLMLEMLPQMDRLALVTDSRFYGVYTRILFEAGAKKHCPAYPVEYLDARFVQTDSLLRRLPAITKNTGVLMTSWLTGEHGFEYSKDYIYKEMASELKAPIFITNNIGIEKGYFIGGYFNRADFWGEAAGEMLLAIVGGKSPKEIAPVTLKDEQCYINWRVMNKFNLSEKNLSENVVYMNRPESILGKYKVEISIIVLILTVLVASYIYTLRSHLRLRSAQKETLSAIEETTAANEQLRKIRQHLIEALKKAEEADRLKSAFLANMSHEIRTPLNAIVGFSELITTAEDDAERVELAPIIRRNSDLLLQLISDILDLSKIESGTVQLTCEETSFDSICCDVVTSLHDKCTPLTTLSFIRPEQSIMGYTDQNYLTQILVNLVGNALKFTRSGSIEVGYFPGEGHMVEFYVKDTGVGIPQEQIGIIFDRFVKVNNYIEGTGLGLAICKTMVTILGGSIGVESELGVGSRFWFRIKKEMNPSHRNP